MVELEAMNPPVPGLFGRAWKALQDALAEGPVTNHCSHS